MEAWIMHYGYIGVVIGTFFEGGGCANMNIARFLVIDFLMAALWAGLLSFVGYSFGNVIYIFVTDVTRYHRLVVPVVVAGAITVILFYRYFVRRKER